MKGLVYLGGFAVTPSAKWLLLMKLEMWLCNQYVAKFFYAAEFEAQHHMQNAMTRYFKLKSFAAVEMTACNNSRSTCYSISTPFSNCFLVEFDFQYGIYLEC